MKLDLSVIILTYNEEIHIRRCLENVNQFASKVYVVDCFSKDKTKELAEEMGAKVFLHSWPGNQAEQFNWALDNLPISTQWILRLDADEYLLPELIDEMQKKIPKLSIDISAISLSLARAFCGKILHHGIVNDVKIIRLFRYGNARYENRLMDEHLSVLSGRTIEFKNQFVDDNCMTIGQFINKHNGYAAREAALLLDAEYHLTATPMLVQDYGKVVEKTRRKKARYSQMPLFWRAFGYFIYRYFFKLGLLDGKEGFLWDFMQGWWYRTLVDAKVYEIKKHCGNDKEKIRNYLSNNYNISL
jgi:glycosyltransferase involved in cell wall biosynthesis